MKGVYHLHAKNVLMGDEKCSLTKVLRYTGRSDHRKMVKHVVKYFKIIV